VNQRLIVCALAAVAVACGGGSLPSFTFQPSNLPATFNVTAAADMLFGSGGCGPRVELGTEAGNIRCFDSGGVEYAAPFQATITNDIIQSDSTPLMVFAGKNITINAGTEVLLRGNRPAVLVSFGDITIAGRITAQDPFDKHQGQGGGFSGPASTGHASGLGPGGGGANDTSGAGGGSYCGVGGKGGDVGVYIGSSGGVAYGTADLIPLRGGSSGGKRQQSNSGAGGGAIQLVASGKIVITAGAVINMGGLGGLSYGSAGGSGGAVLIEGDTVTIEGNIAANGGGGGGGGIDFFGAEDGDNATGDRNPAQGGAGSTGGTSGSSPGGMGSAGDTINGAASGVAASDPGGGGGGAGWIRINTTTGAPTINGLLSPSDATACTTTGVVTPRTP